MKDKTLLEEKGGVIKALALTGIRSEYDLLYPLLKKMDQDSSFDLGVVVSGAHLTSLHNYSVNQIREDGFTIVEEIDTYNLSNDTAEKVNSIGSLLQHLSKVLEREKPDLLMVLGDREEVIVAGVAGSYMRIPVVHLAAGDATYPEGGDVDEEIRFAASKLSHVFLTMNEEHSHRMKLLGEEEWRIHTVGNPGLDKILETPRLSRAELSSSLGENILSDYAVFIYHVLSSYDQESVEREVVFGIEAALSKGIKLFIGAPNSDPGFEWVEEIYERYQNHSDIVFYRNLPRTEFVNLLIHAKLLLGNSSLGIHEAGFLGLPVVNIGQRQVGRMVDDQVVFVSGKDSRSIEEAIEQAAFNQEYRSKLSFGQSVYGDGKMVEKSIEVLKNLPSKNALLAKKLTY